MMDIEALIYGIFTGVFIAYIFAWIYLKIQMREAHTVETKDGRKARYRYAYYVVYHFRTTPMGFGRGCSLLLRETKISNYDDILSAARYIKENNNFESCIIESYRKIRKSRTDLLKTEQEGGEKLE